MILLHLFVSLPIIFLSFLLHKSKNGGKTFLPPGPIGLPFIGNLHQYDTFTPHLYFWKLSKKYGKIFSLKLGSTPMVVISSAKLAKEVLKTQDLSFCSRPSLFGQQKLSYNGHEIIFTRYSDYWREMRKICVLHLLSLKKVQSFSPIREDEVSRMIKKISQQADSSKVINLSSITISLISTIICRIGFGVRYEEKEHEMKRFDYLLAEAQAMMARFILSDVFPSLYWIDKLTGLIDRIEKIFKELDEFYEELIEKHLDPNRPKSMDGDILDLLLKLKEEKSTSIDLTMEDIKGLVMNVLVAGTDTSSAGIVWSMTALIKNPKAMKKVQAEIRNSKAMEKSTLQGYEIQPGTIIQVSSWAIARDPEIWVNPEEFMPERFLNSNIDYKGQDFELIPFGAGRRGCPGIALGVASLELALSNLLYAFDWELPCGMKIEDIDTDVSPGITMHKKNALCLVPGKYL